MKHVSTILQRTGAVVGLGLALWGLAWATGVLYAPKWAHPAALLLLPVVLLAPLQGGLTGVNRLALPGLSATPPRRSLRAALAWVPGAAGALGLGCLVIALAGPREVHRDVRVKHDGLDILLAVDTSGSMEAKDLSSGLQPVSRLAVAKGVMAQFVEARPNDRMGLVVFGEDAFTQVPLTLDHDTLFNSLEIVQLGIAGGRGTAIGQAIAVGARRLKQVESKERILILLTDGQNNAGRIDPFDAAELAAEVGVRIYTIGIGDSRARRGLLGALVRDAGPDEATLRGIAERTGGQYFRATTARALARVYATIDTLETSPAEVADIARPIPWFRWIAVPGVLLVLVQMVLLGTWLRRSP